MHCKAPGCTREAGRYGRLCPMHIVRQRTHGHPQQAPVNRKELYPWLDSVRPIIDRNRHKDGIKIAEERWIELLKRCGNYAVHGDGKGHVNHAVRKACESLCALAREATFEEVFETVAALLALQAYEPRRFVSDAAFSVQLARSLRRLGTTSVGSYYDRNTGKMRGVYRKYPRHASLYLARLVIEAIGGAAMCISKAVLSDWERTARLNGQYLASLAEIG